MCVRVFLPREVPLRACVSPFVCACVCSFSVAAEKKKRRRKKWPQVAEQAKPGAGDQREAKREKRECGKIKLKSAKNTIFVKKIMLPTWIVMFC